MLLPLNMYLGIISETVILYMFIIESTVSSHVTNPPHAFLKAALFFGVSAFGIRSPLPVFGVLCLD